MRWMNLEPIIQSEVSQKEKSNNASIQFSSVAQLCPPLATPQTPACQACLSMGFSRQEYCNGLPFPPPGDLPDPGIKPTSPALQANSLSLSHWRSPGSASYLTDKMTSIGREPPQTPPEHLYTTGICSQVLVSH